MFRRVTSAAAIALHLAAAGPAMAQPMDPTEVADRVAIHDLMMRYALAHDTTNAALYPDIFAPEAQVLTQNGVVIQDGLDAILAGVESDRARFNPTADGSVETYGAMRHLVTNTTIDVHGETATGVSYVQTEVYDDVARRPAILSVGRYEDEFVKRDGRWLIARRMIILDWGDQELGVRMGFIRQAPMEQ
jgi:hypothetical protein